MADILKAKPVVKEIYNEIANELQKLEKQPVLALILIGRDPAAEWYVDNLSKKGKKHGIKIELHEMDAKVSEAELLQKIHAFNSDQNISGIMLQKPLPAHINEDIISFKIDPDKDVDGFHPRNLGKLLLNQDAMLPCTPQAVIELLRFYKIETDGKHVVILGRSNIVGKPLANMLIQKKATANATVTICHSHTKNIASLCRQADILIAAIGKPHFVDLSMVTKDTVVIDVGTNLVTDENGKEFYTGDVNYESVSGLVKAVSPVPGGVGSVTTSLLLRNVIFAAKKLKKRKIIDDN